MPDRLAQSVGTGGLAGAMSSAAARPVALVTGPTAGIGRVFALRLAERGYDLVLVARDQERLAGARRRARRGATARTSEVLVADLSDRAGMALVEDRLADESRPVDLLVNNAGFGLKRRFLDNTVDQEQAALDILVTAVMRLTHAALGPMTARGSGGIINVASVAAYQPRGSYSAAKAWVTTFGAWASQEYAPQGVHIMTLCPGLHPHRVPRADGRTPRRRCRARCGSTSTAWSTRRSPTGTPARRCRSRASATS